ncbi:hypothetical protein H4R34_001704 [Dimargaris verticillata]|uniref:RRM domain-containing protein n=1 Tax=Dimargaris verticillata TaxID=2761393 RepID=A0A9W8B520_9FUNG|nr:hypothetical protein H4R34_001704 [Dimargaris verticillata]
MSIFWQIRLPQALSRSTCAPTALRTPMVTTGIRWESTKAQPEPAYGKFRTVYVANLPSATVRRHIEALFQEFGPVHTVAFAVENEPTRPDELHWQGQSTTAPIARAALVTMDAGDAKKAIPALDGYNFNGSKLAVRLQKSVPVIRSGQINRPHIQIDDDEAEREFPHVKL